MSLSTLAAACFLAGLLNCSPRDAGSGPPATIVPPPAAANAVVRLAYGPAPAQFGDLRLPASPAPAPVALVLHGGCWQAVLASLDHTAALAEALRREGYATWNVEYRRLGEAGGGWPGTFQDAGAALDFVRVLARRYPGRLDTARVVVGLYNLRAFEEAGGLFCGGGIGAQLVGGDFQQQPVRWRLASPVSFLPWRVPGRRAPAQRRAARVRTACGCLHQPRRRAFPMQIQLNTDNNLTGTIGLSQHVETLLTTSLGRFSADITRMEVHLGDENSSTKAGIDDKRCVLEARLPGHAPLVVTHHASTIKLALDGGVERMKHLLANTLDRRKDHR